MIHIEKILFPTDFSECANKALGHAVVMAQLHHARLILLHVRTLIEDDSSNPAHRFPELREQDRALESSARQKLEDAGRALDPGLQVEKVVERGLSSADRIIEYARDQNIDMIVMGTHGHTGLRHFLLGSVAEKVVRFAPCPALTVGHDEGQFPQRRTYKRILVPTDFSDNSHQALKYGLQFAALHQARLDLLHVVEPAAVPAYYSTHVSYDATTPDLIAATRRELDRLWAREIPVNVEVQSHVVSGRVHIEIAGFARANFVDLIVMGTHGLAGLEHIIMGSVTEKVVRTAPCPVLAVKLKEREIIDAN